MTTCGYILRHALSLFILITLWGLAGSGAEGSGTATTDEACTSALLSSPSTENSSHYSVDPGQPIGLVDPDNSAWLFVEELHRRGFHNLVLLRTPHQVAPELRAAFNEGMARGPIGGHAPFNAQVQLPGDGDLPTTLAMLEPYDFGAIIPGIETAVMVTDQLTEEFGLPTNGTRLSLGRRHKYFMQEIIRQAGLRAITQAMFDESGSVEDAVRWYWEQAQSRGGASSEPLRVVVKPALSAGSDAVMLVQTEEELRQAYLQIMGATNKLGIVNREVLVQRFVEGDEYVVNIVGLDGEYVIASIWKYHKVLVEIGGRQHFLYAHDELLPARGPIQQILVNYALKVLEALEIRNGPAHMEIMVTPSGNPVLVEVGARVGGSNTPKLAKHALGRGQIELTLDALLAPERFRQQVLPLEQAYELRRQARIVNLIASGGGTMPREFIEAIRHLSSYYDDRIDIEAGAVIPMTTDLFSSPGYVFLAHEDETVIERDIQQIRALEQMYFASGESAKAG